MSNSAKLQIVLLALVIAPSVLSAQRGGGAPPTGIQQGPPLPAPPPGSGAISGVVVDGSTNQPVAGAVVLIGSIGRPSGLPQTSQLTDAKGRFAFVNLPTDGNFTLMASKTGYLAGGFGREGGPTDGLRSILVREGEWVANTRVTLWRPGAISGMVRDERGEPVVGVYVRAFVRIRLQGRDEVAAGPLTTTDDRGVYRFAGLTPARYVIQVPSVQVSTPTSFPFVSGRGGVDGVLEAEGSNSRINIGRYPLPPPPVNGRAVVYPIAFHPSGGAIAQAVAIDLKFAEDRSGIDITLEPVPTSRVSGVVEGPVSALRNLTLRLLPAGLESLGQGAEIATALVEDNGHFMFLNVPAGSYVLDAPRTLNQYTWSGSGGRSASLPAPPSFESGWGTSSSGTDIPNLSFQVSDFRSGSGNYTGRMPVTVGSTDVTNLVLTMRGMATLGGYFKTEQDPSKPAPPALPRFSALAESASGAANLGTPRAVYDADMPPDEFVIGGLAAGEYYLRVPSIGGWMVKSIQWKGREYLDTPFDATTAGVMNGIAVTMTNVVSAVKGSVREPDGTTPSSATVLVFPVSHALWTNMGITPPRLKSITVGSAGAYSISVPPGDYFVVAVQKLPASGWRDPEFLALAERFASRVSVTWGAETTQNVSLSQVR